MLLSCMGLFGRRRTQLSLLLTTQLLAGPLNTAAQYRMSSLVWDSRFSGGKTDLFEFTYSLVDLHLALVLGGWWREVLAVGESAVNPSTDRIARGSLPAYKFNKTELFVSCVTRRNTQSC